MMRHWHQHTSTQPGVAAACDGYQIRLFTRAERHTHTAGSGTAMYGFDPDPAHLNAAPYDTDSRMF